MDLQHSILQTLKYSDIFKFPLTSKEIYKYLISETPYPFLQVEKTTKTLVQNKKIKKLGKYYGLNSLPRESQTKREESKKMCKEQVSRAKRDLKNLARLPFVKMTAITGSVAAKNCSQKADVDLFIVTSKNFLWITRLITVLYLKMLKKYKNPYCANIYIPINNLTWNKKNIYVANEVARLYPLFNKNNTYELFLQKNTWACEYLANFKGYIPKFNIKHKNSFVCALIFPIEYLLFLLQTFYMKNKITTEQIGLKYIHFLKNDYTGKVLNGFSD